jgi:D-alanyl-D-alanine carboxypeptidase
MKGNSEKPVRLVSYEDDQPVEVRGSLIPRPRRQGARTSFAPSSTRPQSGQPGMTGTAVAVFAVAALAVLGTSGYGYLSDSSQTATPILSVYDQVTGNATTIDYGLMPGLSQETLFTETRDAFIDEELTFIEIDETDEQVRFFVDGVLLVSERILHTSEVGSVHELASGLYQVTDLTEEEFNNLGQVNLPWLIRFHGNYLIHGQPTDRSGEPVERPVGGVTLSNPGAKKLFSVVGPDTPVLVRKALPAPSPQDNFVYQLSAPAVGAVSYLVADSANGTLLVGEDIDTQLPIASITKLMTAIVATENYDLNTRVRVASPNFVTSLIPRLSETSTVTMYSLLQLALLESSNEATETIAGEMGRAEFIAAMNQKARQLGMMDTTFADPSGLSSDNVSTAQDLQRLIEYISTDKSFILNITANRTLPSVYVGNEFAGLVNFNEVEDMKSFVGGKVGETSAALQTSLSLHEIEIGGSQREVTVVILGSESRNDDIENLLQYVRSVYNN